MLKRKEGKMSRTFRCIVPWSEMVASARRKAPTLEEEYRLFPSWLASKIFPLRAGDCSSGTSGCGMVGAQTSRVRRASYPASRCQVQPWKAFNQVKWAY